MVICGLYLHRYSYSVFLGGNKYNKVRPTHIVMLATALKSEITKAEM